ncbi:hypothetical protein TSUD_31730 [Trifolium subterraneum]|uniref:Uncharacterized protein n=1 Tax=Trifolium subterraneum TaxID=3900 RepID=A0A2Z6NI47_TRISU|nr:hypothetical protein TSUD_31730 [Trifolium subterraneum]
MELKAPDAEKKAATQAPLNIVKADSAGKVERPDKQFELTELGIYINQVSVSFRNCQLVECEVFPQGIGAFFVSCNISEVAMASEDISASETQHIKKPFSQPMNQLKSILKKSTGNKLGQGTGDGRSSKGTVRVKLRDEDFFVTFQI